LIFFIKRINLINASISGRVARFKKIQKAKFGHNQFQKGQILKNEKRPNKGQISFKKIVKITKLKFRIPENV